MNVSNDSAATNYVDYFTKQLPIDLATLASLRDEIAKWAKVVKAAGLAVQ